MTAPANKCERCESMQREAIDGFGMLLELNAQECDASGADREARYLRILRTKMKERGYFTAPADPVRDAERAVVDAAEAVYDNPNGAWHESGWGLRLTMNRAVVALRAARENKNTAQRERRDVGEKTEGSDDVLGQPSHYERRTPDSEPSNASTTEGRILPGRTTSEVRAESPAVLGPVAHGAPHSAGVDHPQAETFPPSPAPVAPAPRCPKCQHLPGPLPMPKDIEKDYRLVWSCPCDCHAPAPQWTEPTREALIRGIADALHTDIDGRYECQRCPVAADAAAALYAPELAGLRADRDANREIKMRLAAQSDRLASEKRTLSEDVDSLRDILETRNEQIAALKADMSTCYSAKSQAIQRADAHAAEATELRKRWADRASIPACAYCEWEGDLSDTEGLRVQAKAHVATCQKHPQRALESEARDLRARVETLTKAGRELNEACQRDIEAIRAEAPPARRSGDVEACAKELREHWIKTRACQTPYHDDFAAILLKHFPLPAAREVTVTAEDVGEAIKKHMDWLTSRAAQTAIAADLTARLRSAKDKSDAT